MNMNRTLRARPLRGSFRTLLVLSTALVAAACSNSRQEGASGSAEVTLQVGAGSLSMAVGESVPLHAALSTNSTRLYTLTYVSSDETVASVSGNGLVTALAGGNATITLSATLLDTGATAGATVQVAVAGAVNPRPPPLPSPPPGPQAQATFSADTTTELQNPERGYYFSIGPGEACSSVLTAVRDGADYQQKAKLAYYAVNPATFKSSSFEADMACVRAAGMKIILAESYCSRFLCNEGVTIDQAESQLAAMVPAVHANRDVIAVVRVGVIGAWGEGASWGGSDVPDSVRNRVRDAIVNMAPPEIPMVHRDPMYVFQWYPVTTTTTAFDGSVGSRLGIVNDCFLSGSDDHYTYPDSGLRAKTAAQTEFTPFGGETCNVNEARNPSRLACTGGDLNDGSPGGIMNEGPRYHLSYLHRGYADVFMTAWGGLDDQGKRGPGTCYDTVTNSMGYRFQMDAVRHPSTVSRGQTATVDIDLRDVGWARVFSARKLEVTLLHKTNGSAPAIGGGGGDARLLPSQATSSTRITVSIPIPSGATPGDYEVFIGMPDIWPTTKNDVRQAVRFANADNPGKGQSWDAATARFKSGTTVTVQ